MTQMNPYLTFNGNCREAMCFYKDILGGELNLQTIGESPMAANMPTSMKDFILHAQLSNGALVMMASDMVADSGLVKGNAVSLMLGCSSETQIRSCYEKLAAGGKADHPLENTFWDTILGDLTDKYGNHWLLHFDQKMTVDQSSPINQPT